MRSDDIFDAIGAIDDKLIASAGNTRGKKPKQFKWTVLIAAVLSCLILTGALLSFALFDGNEKNGKETTTTDHRNTMPDISQYSSSPYYAVIEKLAQLNKDNNSGYPNRVPGNFDAEDMPADDGFNEPTTAPPGNEYHETTDNQVEGVIEGDLLKRSDKYAFYINGRELRIYDIISSNYTSAQSYVMPVATYTLSYKSKDGAPLYTGELYLSKDVKTATVIASYYNYAASKKQCVDIISLDVSDINNISEKSRITVTGSYLSSRSINGELIVVLNSTVSSYPNYGLEEDFIPQINTGDGFKSVGMDSILIPDNVTSARYSVILKINESDGSVKDCKALLSRYGSIYVSQNNIYLASSFTENVHEYGYRISTSKTEIICLSHTSKKLDVIGCVTLDGSVKDQYSMDEHNGVLRVVLTSSTGYAKISNVVQDPGATLPERGTNANLYCIGLDSFEIIAKVIGFAPQGETVESVRFDGDFAYVCTAVVITITDPVFFFDLSDLDNITYKDTGTIEGFSSSLVDFGDGYLLGIGVDENWCFKLEIYKEGESTVESVCKYEPLCAFFPSDYKAFYIDRKNQVIGMALGGFTDNRDTAYILLKFDGERFVELYSVDIEYNRFDQIRAFVADGVFFVIDGYAMHCSPLRIYSQN